LQNPDCGCVDVPVLLLLHVVRVCPFTVVVPEVWPLGHEPLPGALVVVLFVVDVDVHRPPSHFVVPVVVLVVELPSLLFLVVLDPVPEAVGLSPPTGAQILVPLKSPGA
jgi:hypothetical protein